MGKGRTAPHLHVGIPGNETRALLLLVTWTQFNDSNSFVFFKVRCHKHSNNPSFRKYVYSIKRIKMKYKPFYLQLLYRLTKSQTPQIKVKL